jgi:hypothetical protein
MRVSKSMDFLLEKAGPVIRYRLHKEILRDLRPAEEEALLERVLQTPYYRLVESYVKSNGYIGTGMHSWDKFKETPLQDGEAAARVLSNYAIPKDRPIVRNFISALRDERILEEEFSYYHPEVVRFQNRFLGLRNGGGLMVLVYTAQALLGYGDDPEAKPFVDISREAFRRVLSLSSLEDITIFKPYLKRKYNFPYIEEDVYFPCQYHLETLAHTRSWRTPETVAELARAVNHLNAVMREDNAMTVKIGSRYYGPLWAFVRPLKPFTSTAGLDVARRKTLTHLAMLGAGDAIDVVRQSAQAVMEGLMADGILRVSFASPYIKKRYLDNMRVPGPYSEIGLETAYKKEESIWCDLTFWGVQLLHLLHMAEF